MIEHVFLSPMVTFLLFVLLGLGLSWVAAKYAAGGKESERKLEAYACGQRQIAHNVSPDYSQFFPYAFFFTIMHVLTLVVATTPPGALMLPLLYVAGGMLALVIIFRR